VAGIESGNRIPFAEFIKRRKGFLLIIFLIILNILGLQLFYALNKNDTILPHEKLLYEYRLKNPRVDYIDNLDTYEKIYNGKWLNNDKYGVIHRIAVSDKFRNCGVSNACFEFSKNEALKANV
jgi:hypothetical protein